MNHGAGNQKVVHFKFPAGFVGRLGGGVCGSGSAAFGDGIHVFHDFAEVVAAEAAFKSDIRRFNEHRTHDDFVRKNR